MSAREWKPGDVARLKGHGVDAVAIRTVKNSWAWVDPNGSNPIAGHLCLCADDVDARPLVVIDAEDEAQVEAIVKAFVASGVWRVIPAGVETLHRHRREQVAAALRECANPTPPKPDEPTGRYAVVEDADGLEWVLADPPTTLTPWKCLTLDCWAEYDDIKAVKVLSGGVTP